MSDVMIFQFIGDSVTNAMGAYVESTVPAVIQTIISTAVLMGALYYSIIGILMALGRVNGAFSQLIISAGKFILVGAIALNAGTYTKFVVETGHDLEIGITQAFAGQNGAKPNSAYEVIDQSVGKGFDLSSELWNRASNRGMTKIGMMVGEYVEAMIIATATLTIAVPASAMIIASKALFELMLGIGPLFIMFLVWPITKGFFDRWFGEIMTAILQIALVSAVLAFAMKVFVAVVSATNIDNPDASPFFDCLRLIAVTVVMLWLMYVAYQKGAALGGGMSSAAITLGALAARASGLGSAVVGAVNPVSTRRDLESGMMVTAGRTNHLVAGNTMWNPSYLQHVLDNVGKNWGRARGGSVQG
ncbi:type IV secretion system protein [Xanthomonas citri]|uniref:type IV secretion system protein n=2 Tax=Xanthomonas TaxID=338 RepID=UPI0005284B05|nr:type IV secretion system protein [Xanthomonas citri]KGP22448.1 conjugal transfer protein TraH [Xanthomonas phaseoli pv. phaseoli]KGP22815.1 conjugal transfer protein TraH [Xanthomonas citri pv. fuscans]KGP24732.1 conjugal transfer protein TraH [Xanthomonas citri pv. fuscans]KGP33506.1 conjugal transfer protein TraH [Xanthomonas citri pv. fuscans]SON77434.1 Type IV secretion system protein VirB6 [Xanthomonas citri pv. fuscans]